MRLLTEADEGARRRVAARVSRLALDRVPVSDPQLRAALALIERYAFGDSPERDAVQSLVDQLDRIAWDIQERVEAGSADEADYVAAFAKARAVNAVWYALASDALDAAAEATYEAAAAIDDPESLSAAVQQSAKRCY